MLAVYLAQWIFVQTSAFCQTDGMMSTHIGPSAPVLCLMGLQSRLARHSTRSERNSEQYSDETL